MFDDVECVVWVVRCVVCGEIGYLWVGFIGMVVFNLKVLDLICCFWEVFLEVELML